MWGQEDGGKGISVRQAKGKSCQGNVCFQIVSVSGKNTFRKSQLHPRVPFPEFIKRSVLKQLVVILACSISGWLSHPHRAVFCMLFRIFIENTGFPHALFSRLIVMLLLTLRWWLHLTTCLLGDKECCTEINVPASVTSLM